MKHSARSVRAVSSRSAGAPAGRPRPSLAFRQHSVFQGLARREVGSLDVVAHSVAVLVPSLTALGSGLAFPSMIGPGWWISTVLGYVLVGLFGATFNQFATRFKSAGTLYTFVAKGLGALSALSVAGGLIIGYAAVIGFGLADAAGRADSALTSTGLDRFAGPGRELVLLVVGAAMCLYAIGRGIHWSTRAALVAEVASFVVLGVVLVTWVGRYGLPSWDVLSLAGASPQRILTGAAFILMLTLAFESSASLGLETKRPFIDVPFALRSSIWLAATLFAIANLVASMRPADAPSVWTWRWFSPGAEHSIVDAFVLVVLAWSLVALALCAWSALARLLFSLAREGVLPAAPGRVNRRGVPVVAAWAVTPLAVVPPLIAVLSGPGAGAFSWELKEAAGVVICAAYALAALSLLRLLRAIDEVTIPPILAAVVAASGAGAVAINELRLEFGSGSVLAAGMLVVAFGLGLVMRRRVRRLEAHGDRAGRYVGMHDEALTCTVYLPPHRGDGPRVGL